MPANLGGTTGLILVIIVLVLFAAPKLPQIAKSIAQSMTIFKKEIRAGSDTPSSEKLEDDGVEHNRLDRDRLDSDKATTVDEKNQKN